METPDAPPEELRRHIAGDLDPVRPAPPPWMRALADYLPWAVGLSLPLVLGFGLRPDFDAIGPLFGWTASASFMTAGFVFYACFAREVTPGRRLPASYVAVGVALLVALQVGVAAALHATHPQPAPPGQELSMALACAVFISAIALLVFVSAMRLARRSLVQSRAVCAVLATVPAVVLAEAIWRLHCPFTSVAHLAAAHLTPYVLMALIGALVLRRRGAEARHRC